MSDLEAVELARPVVKAVVDCIAERCYQDVAHFAELKGITQTDLEEIVEGFLELNELSHIDSFDVPCNFSPKYEYHQLECIVYRDGSGFHMDYNLTTDEELNDLTLQMEFLVTSTGTLIAKVLDVHIM